MMNKQYYFLVGLPRSGNTLLGAILNQNPKISVTANSVVPTILWKLEQEKQTNLAVLNFPDYNSYDNILKNVFNNYYDGWNSEIILDRSSWSTPNNLELIKKYCPNKPKFIVLVRDILEVLASFVKWSEENPSNFLNYETGNGTVEEKCEFLMSPSFQIVQEYSAIHSLFVNTEHFDSLFITYDELVSDTQNQLKNIYSFLNLEEYAHNLNSLEQLSSNGVQYNDKVVGDNLHHVRPQISKVAYSVHDYLPESVIKKYSGLSFWSKEAVTA